MELEANATTAIVGLIGVILSMISGVAGYMIKREGRIGELSGIVKSTQTTVEALQGDVKDLKKDVNGLGKVLGTPKSIGLQKETQETKF